MLIENTASLWGTTTRWYCLHKIVVVSVTPSYYAFLIYTLLKNYISNGLLFPCHHIFSSRDFTQMNELCEKARHLFFHLFRWDLIHYAYQKWKLMSLLEGCFTKPFLQIFSVPDGSGGPCLSLQPVWSPGERDQPGGREYSKKEMNQVAGIAIF